MTLTIGKFFTEACRSKSDGNLRREKMREFQKSFCGEFYRKVFRESFAESFLQGNFNGKSFTGEMGNQVWIETWKVADPSQLQLRVTDLLAPPDLPNFLT